MIQTDSLASRVLDRSSVDHGESAGHHDVSNEQGASEKETYLSCLAISLRVSEREEGQRVNSPRMQGKGTYLWILLQKSVQIAPHHQLSSRVEKRVRRLTLDGAPRSLQHDGTGVVRLLALGFRVDSNEV